MSEKEVHLKAALGLLQPVLVRQWEWEIYGCFQQGYHFMEEAPF